MAHCKMKIVNCSMNKIGKLRTFSILHFEIYIEV
jgi:hypothetical protein